MKLAILLFVGLCSAAYAAAGSGTWNNVPDIADRAFWETQKSRPGMSILLKRAEEEVKTPRESPLPHYLDFRNTGNRTIYQKKFLELYRIAPLTLASCVTGEKRFIEALENRVRTVAGLPTWVLPAHDPALKNYRGETVEIDLGAAAAGTELVCALALLEPAMTPDTARLLRSELMRRIVIPLEEMMDGSRKEAWWLNTKSNWNSVCISGMAAIALRIGLDVPRREKLLSFLLKRSENFLKGFGSDGYCSEGISYWFYGFGYYLRMAADVYQATGGKIRLTERSDVRLPAAFAEKFLLAPRVYPAFADADPDARPNRFVLNLRNWLYGGSAGFPRNIMLSNGLQDLCLMLSLPQTEQRTADAVRLPALSQFRDAGVFLVRPGDSASRLAVAFKGGAMLNFTITMTSAVMSLPWMEFPLPLIRGGRSTADAVSAPGAMNAGLQIPSDTACRRSPENSRLIREKQKPLSSERTKRNSDSRPFLTSHPPITTSPNCGNLSGVSAALVKMQGAFSLRTVPNFMWKKNMRTP